MDMKDDLKPYAVTFSDQFDYEVRCAAMRILDQGCTIGRVGADEVLAHPRAGKILMCLSCMAYGGFVDYYRGDDEAARWTVAREYGIVWDLSHLEQQIEFSERTAELKADLVQREQEIRADRAAARRTPKLPPGAPVSMRGLAILRQREREE